MIAFWAVAGLLLAGALLFIVPPLIRRAQVGAGARDVTVSIYRDQLAELDSDLQAGTITREHFDKGRQELEHRLLDDVPVAPDEQRVQALGGARRLVPAAVTGIAIPVCAILLYYQLGHPEAIAPRKVAAATQDDAHTMSPEQIALMVDRLAARLKENPNDAVGWQMLARSYNAFGRFPEAADAYKKAAALAPRDPQLLADYADTLAVANGSNLNGKPLELIQAALGLDPNHQKSLALAGTAAFNNREYAAAIAYWQRLQKTFPADSDNALAIGTSIAEARAAAGGSATPIARAPTANTGAASAAPVSTIAGAVSLSPALAAKALPTDTVFIFARAVNGPRMPLAIVRIQASDLPKAFSLDDSMAMAPAMKLSNFQEVMVGARVSKSGNATPQSGDLMGSIGPVKVGSRELKVVIDAVVP